MTVAGITLPRTPGLVVEVELPDHKGEIHAYRLEVLAPAHGEIMACRVTQLDRDGATYRVAQTATDEQVCSCPDFVYRKKRMRKESCKHGLALRELGLLSPIEKAPHASDGTAARPATDNGTRSRTDDGDYGSAVSQFGPSPQVPSASVD